MNRNKPLVLHIDDSTTILIVTQGMLAKLGCDVVTASDGAQGLALAEKKQPDLILLDTQMPGLDGCEVCVQLKLNPKTKAIPIIMVTGMDVMKDVEKALASGAAGYIPKPIDEARLKSKISALIKLP